MRNLGKGCYEAAKAADPAQYQADAYNKRKREIMEKIDLSSTAKALVKRIYISKRQEIPKLKANLVRLQKGQIKVRDPPNDEEWESHLVSI